MYCGFENPEMSKFCGKCGKTFGGEKTSEKKKEIGQPSYKKFLPVVGVLVILLLGYWVIAPKTNDVTKILESTPTSSDPTNVKTSESSSPLPASKSTASTASSTDSKATPGSRTIILEHRFSSAVYIPRKINPLFTKSSLKITFFNKIPLQNMFHSWNIKNLVF
jgi:cytoskeletal protein RodZ